MGDLDELARQRIGRWREAQNMTQADFAKRIGRNPVWVSRYLDAAYDADLDTLNKMATALGHTLYELFNVREDADERTLIEAYRALSPANRALGIATLRAMIPAPRKPPRSRDTR